ncbi:MAG: DPP IV N-terminal domain-containing protein [Anaerolineales bacterium]
MKRVWSAGFIFMSIILLTSACALGQTTPGGIPPVPTSAAAPATLANSAVQATSVVPAAPATPTAAPLPGSTLPPTPAKGPALVEGQRWIAYVDEVTLSAQEDVSLENIYKFRINDPNAKPIALTHSTDPSIHYYYPAWSPDGQQIAFEKFTIIKYHQQVHELYLMDGNGGNMTKISPALPANLATGNLLVDMEPAWSPDGKKIVFASNRASMPSNPNNYQIFIMDMSTFAIHPVTNMHGSCETPAWSPDGKTIAFMSNQTGKYAIWTVDINGDNLKQVTLEGATDRFPRWSPDGTKIIFHSDVSGIQELYTIASDSTNLTQLTSGPSANTSAEYSPDGDWIVFQSNRAGTESLFTMASDGTQVQQISTGTDENFLGNWQP